MSNSNEESNNELTRRILSRQYELIDKTTSAVSKPLWKIIPLKSFVSNDEHSMTHACRCGGLFVLSNDDFDDLNAMFIEESNRNSKDSCELENEDCECHELIEVECETCSLVVGVKMALL